MKRYLVVGQFEMNLNYLSDPQQQKCKVCGNNDKFNFNVQNKIWEAIVPPIFQNNVVCLACFDAFAALQKLDYTIDSLYFAGEQKTFGRFRL